jgi:hypothetical protein
MKISKLLLICICCLIAAPAVWGQAANSQAHHGILGYLDPQTGAFRPAAPAAEDAAAEPPPVATFTGTLNLTITVTIKSVGITSVFCSMNTSVTDAPTTISPRFFDESNSVTASGTGTTRTCKLSIPYSWALATQSSDSMVTSYSVTGTPTTTTALPNRNSTLSPYNSTKVPATGTTTTLPGASVTI